MSLIELKNVLKRYDSKLSVDHLNIKIEEGEIFGLLGPNGAGKSTTIKMICGMLKIDQGTITVDGMDVHRNPIEVKRKIGLVPQDLAIYPELTAKENVTFFGKLYGLKGQLLAKKVQEALDFVGLVERQKERSATFSGGMKRRLNIACAIVHHPKVLIMDEPTVGIDPQSRNHILECVKKLNQNGSTVIYTSHYMEEVAAISTRIGIIDKGHLIALGTQDELRKEVAHEEKIILVVSAVVEKAIDELKRHPSIKDVVVADLTIEIYLRDSESYLQDILFIMAKHHMAIQSLKRMEPNLETLFLSLTGRTLRD